MPIHKAATALLSLLLVTTTHAGDELQPIEICTDMSLIARQVMIARQQDRPMSSTLPEATNQIKKWGDKYGLEMDLDEAEEMAADMVMAAYEEMISSGDKFKRQRTTEFENAFFKECYEELTSDSEE